MNNLNLCKDHKQEWKQSEYDKENCDYCKLLAENEMIKNRNVKSEFKKYILFQYDDYYSSGGLGDMRDSFDTIEEAVDAIKNNRRDSNEIVDRDTWEIVMDYN